MAWLVPWVIPWLAPWLGADTQVALPPLIPNDTPANGPAADQIASFISSYSPTGAHVDANIVSVDLTISNRCVAPDGFPRVAVLAGSQRGEPTLPGPVISGYKGDRFLINVVNELTDTSMFTGTTVHWHGIHQHHSSQMDGTAYVTQCPISPGKSFLYNFTGGEQFGTFWYHSHYAVQYCDGLRGPLIIRDPEDPFKDLYDVDDDSTIITLMDWYHYPSPLTPRQIIPDSGLIGGKGCYPGLPKGASCPAPTTYEVEKGKRYRFRLLNMACKDYYDFSIDNHNMTVIEVDGEEVVPYTVDSIRVFAAQRYSFVLNANKPVNSYLIHAKPSKNSSEATNVMLKYVGEPEVKPPVDTRDPKLLNEALLRSRTEPPAELLKPEPDVRINVVMGKKTDDFNFLINGVQYTSPSIPILLQIMHGTPSWEIDPQKSVYLLPRNKVIEVIFDMEDAPGRPHPFHLHGHHFAVIKSATSETRNYDRPVMRDTVSTAARTEFNGVTVRFVTDNPGPWILHCHDEWHLYTGMAIVFVEDYEGIQNDPFDYATRELCPYDNSSETFTLPPPRTTEGPFAYTSTCSLPTPTPTGV